MGDGRYNDDLLTTAFPDAKLRTCWWHIRKDMKAHLSAEAIQFVEKELFSARTVSEYDTAWDRFCADFTANNVRYMQRWHEVRERWARPWWGESFSAGMCASSANEATFSAFKRLHFGMMGAARAKSRSVVGVTFLDVLYSSLRLEERRENAELQAFWTRDVLPPTLTAAAAACATV